MTEKNLQDLALDFVSNRTEKSFTSLHNRLKPGLKKYIQKYHQDVDTVDEILAITLSKAYVLADKYDSRWNFSTWIYAICKNECLMEIRRQNALYSLDNMADNKTAIKAIYDEDIKFTPDYELFSDEEVVHADSLYSEVLQEILNLPAHYKEIIEDRIVEKMKYKDIAIKRGLKINTVRSRIHSAKKVIKNLWIEKKRKTNSKTINILGVTILQLLGDDDKKQKKIVHEKNSDIVIISARYGAGNQIYDVTSRVIKIFEEKGEVKASNRIGGDPCYGSAKALFIDYKCNEILFSVEIKEGKCFSI